MLNGRATVSRREAAKAERRHRIIMAARDLIKETGDTGLSMRAIAARAGVALTTPYSLFGSKRAIVIALLEDVREFHERFSRLRRDGAIDRIFHAVSISLDYLADDPEFYRTLWTEVLRFDSKELRGELQSPQRYGFWWALLREAQEEGALLSGIELDPLLRALDAAYVAGLLAWVLGAIDVGELGPRVGYGYALALRGAASDAQRDTVERRLFAFQKELSRQRRAVSGAPAAARIVDAIGGEPMTKSPEQGADRGKPIEEDREPNPGLRPEKVEDRPNVSTVTPEDYPKKDRAAG